MLSPLLCRLTGATRVCLDVILQILCLQNVVLWTFRPHLLLVIFKNVVFNLDRICRCVFHWYNSRMVINRTNNWKLTQQIIRPQLSFASCCVGTHCHTCGCICCFPGGDLWVDSGNDAARIQKTKGSCGYSPDGASGSSHRTTSRLQTGAWW